MVKSIASERYVTHFIRQSRNPQKLIPLAFVTQDEADNYYLGLGAKILPIQGLKKLLATKGCVPLRPGWPIKEGQAVWLTSEDEVIIDNKENPQNDCTRLRVRLDASAIDQDPPTN